MRLSEFLRTHSEEILSCWDEFASTVEHSGAILDPKALRDHAGQILKTIAADLDEPQTASEQVAKSRGEVERSDDSPDTAAETHADTRIVAGFAVDAMITEYRTLRASVLRLWSVHKESHSPGDELQQLTRFNEAIDQAITESVARYTAQTKKNADLFLGILGHDIRNPLGTISLSVEYLVRSGQLSAKSAQPIVNSVQRIKGVIELVVDFSRAQSDGVMPITRKPGNLAEQVEKVIEETRIRHPVTPIELRADGNYEGSWDEARLGQLVSNLLANAISYGAREQPITVTMTGDEKSVTCVVHNHGVAISAEDRARIFEPRDRGSTVGAEQRAPDGLGLGLYICREIVRAHKGTLWVKSRPNEGTSFIFNLPREDEVAD